ncbi:MAG: RsmG family class I SAM-dependent methyltransferase [Pseudomonadota bacterium]
MGTVSRGTSTPQALATALQELRPELPEALVHDLSAHFALMLEWNRTHNLTRVVDPAQAASVHYLDSLLPLLDLSPPSLVADLGSGNGLPGVAAAALWPDTRVVLVESVAKKCSFLRALRSHLPHLKLDVVSGRVESVTPVLAELVLTRATFPWPELALSSRRHLAVGGQLLAYLGREVPSQEQWAELVQAVGMHRPSVTVYSLPPDGAARHCAKACTSA